MNFLFGYWEIVGIKLWIILGFYLVCLGFKNPYIVVLFVLLVGWCQFWFMVIFFLTFYLVGIKFSWLTWRIGSFSDVGRFFMCEKVQSDLFHVSIFFD